MRRIRHSKIVRSSYLGIILAVNACLGLLLIVQLCLGGWLTIVGKFEIPDFILQRLKDDLAKSGVQFDANEVIIDFRGYLLVDQLDMWFSDEKDPFLQAKKVVIGFRPWELLGRNLGLSDVRTEQIQLYSLASAAPHGKRQLLLDGMYIAAHRRWEHWHLHLLRGNFGILKVLLSGSLRLDYLDFEDNSSSEPKTFKQGYQQLCEQLLQAQEQLKIFKNPFVTANLSSSADFPLQMDVLFYADGGRYLVEDYIHFGAHAMHANVGFSKDWVSYGLDPVRITIDDVHLSEDVAVESVQLQCAWGFRDLLNLPQHASGFLYNISAYGISLESLVLHYHDLAHFPLRIHAAIEHASNWLEVEGKLSFKDKTADCRFEGVWDPMFFFEAEPLKQHLPLTKVGFAVPPKFKGKVKFEKDWQFDGVELSVDTGAFHYETLHVEGMHTNAKIEKDQLWLSDTVIYTKDYTVKGNYWQNLSNEEYRFLLHGTLRPLDISFIVDEEWWPQLWDEIKFGEVMPAASIDLRGRYSGGSAYKWMFGYCALPKCTYRGVPLKSATGFLWQLPSHLELLDLHVLTPQNQALVNLEWRYVPHGKDRYSLSFAGAGDIPLEELAKIVPEAEPYAQLFVGEIPPDLKLAGLSYGADSDKNGELFLNFHCRYSNPIVFESITMDRLQFQGLSTPKFVDLQHIAIGIAEGTAHGDALLTKHPNAEPSIKFRVGLTDAQGDKLMNAIPFLQEDDTGKKDEKSKTAKKDNEQHKKFNLGRVDFSMTGDGQIGELDSFKGNGELEIKKGHLGKLHLFGGLSSFLSSIGLNLGIVEFTGVKTSYQWKDSYIHLPDGQIIGPTAKIHVNGNYFIKNSALDFILAIHPLGSFNFPVLAQLLDLFSPLANTIQVKLTGTTKKPKWDLMFTPLGLFNGEKKVEKPK